MKFKGEKYIWQDCRRVLGLPLSFTSYAVSEDRLFLRQGFLNLRDEEILLYRVRDISLRRSLLQRMLGVGTITVISSDRTMPTMVIQNVKNPMQAKELIHGLVEDMKRKRRIHVGEIISSGGDYDDNDFDDRN